MSTLEKKVVDSLLQVSTPTQTVEELLLKQFAQGEHFTLTNGSGAKWNIHLTNMMREDGSGKKFIFKGTLCSTVSPTGNIINKGNTIACEGFVDMATQKGTLKFLPKKNG